MNSRILPSSAPVQGNGRIRRALLFLAVGIPLGVGFWVLVFDAMEKEAQWRADRMCRIYDICDARRGA